MRALAIAAAAAFFVAAPGASAKTLLNGSVGPGFTINLKTAAGKRVTTLKPGFYAIVIDDRSSIHDFHLKGPGVDVKITGVAFEGTKTATVLLRRGSYVYVCDPHRGIMRGSFVVT